MSSAGVATPSDPSTAAPPSQLAARLGSRDNALNLVRLGLAGLVVVGHSLRLGGFRALPVDVGALAVDGFFALSGYLVLGSRVRLPPAAFARRRALRLLPGLAVCLVVTAFVIAPLAALGAGQPYRLIDAARYLVDNLSLFHHHWDIAGSPVGTPFPGVWNGSTWTLGFEALAYVAVGLLLTSVAVRRHLLPVVVALLTIALVLQPLAPGPLHVTTAFYLQSARLGAFFLAGMLLWIVRERLSTRLLPALVSAVVVLAALTLTDPAWQDLLLPVPLAFLLLWLGAVLLTRVASRTDLSYGVYLYAFPLQQALAIAGLQRLGPMAFLGGSVAAVLGPAVLSWHLVEKRALRTARG